MADGLIENVLAQVKAIEAAAAAATPSSPYQGPPRLQTGTTFGCESDGVWLLADYDRDGIPDLVFIKTVNTPSGQVEVHIASGASTYQQRILATPTTFACESDGTWLMADCDGDGRPDLVFIKTANTAGNLVEVHIASAASNYQQRIIETATTFGCETDGIWMLADHNGDGRPDLVFIKTANTAGNKVEVHIASAESNYQARILETQTTFECEEDGVWTMVDYNGDGLLDLAFIKTANAPGSKVEVHIASGASNYRDRVLETGTWFDCENDGAWLLADQSGDGSPDLVFIKTANTGTNSVELHVVAGALANGRKAHLDAEAFRSMMLFIRQLANGVTTDSDEWAKFGEICSDSAAKGIQNFAQRAGELWTDGLDQATWAAIQRAAMNARGKTDRDALISLLIGFFDIMSPSHNADRWNDVKSKAYDLLTNSVGALFGDGADIQFRGADTRKRRLLVDPDSRLPVEMSMSFLIKKNEFPAEYVELYGYKDCHVEYFMRLDQAGPDGSAYFLLTHSQDQGGFVGLAKVIAPFVGQGPADHKIWLAEPAFAGEMVWYDRLDHTHVAGCNHPGNGGQIGSKVVLVGQDWTKEYPVIGHAVTPVGRGSKVLFYDFAMLGRGALPTMGDAHASTNAFVGFLTTDQLQIAPGDDGEISTVLVEQGPDGNFYLIGANRNQTVLWTSPELVPDISKWTKLPIYGVSSMEDGSAMLAWAQFRGGPKALYYVKAYDNGMNFMPLKYQVANGKVVAVLIDPKAEHCTTQSDAFKGKESWVFDDGSIYAGASGGIALYGAYQSISDWKGPEGSEAPCIQVRAWYT